MAWLAIAPATGSIAAAAKLLLYKVQSLLHRIHACLQLQHLRSQSLRREISEIGSVSTPYTDK
jgi:hypothetical protein